MKETLPVTESLETGPSQKTRKKITCSAALALAYQSLGVVYGDLSTSPLYVYRTSFSGKLSLHEDDGEIYGVLSFIFWTVTLIALVKDIFIVISANDNGEGGTFALYSVLCRHAKISILPNHQDMDEALSAYAIEGSTEGWQSSVLKSFCEKHHKFCKAVLIFVLLGTSMAITDGMLTPAISVLSAVSGVKARFTGLHENYIVIISCIILMGLFLVQHHGTRRVAFMFASIVALWLLFTGVEAMLDDLGHFSAMSIEIVFTFFVYPCLVLAYLGEAAFLSRNHEEIQQSFYKAIPDKIFWPVFIIATLAAVIGSQAVITATFSIISQCCALNCFRSVKIVHTSSKISGQIYIPEIYWLLMSLCLAMTVGLKDPNRIGHAYGLAVATVMFITTCLMTLVMIIVRNQNIFLAITFLLIFGLVELLYLSAALYKAPEGGWIPILLSSIFMAIMFIWNYGTLKKYQFDRENKVSMQRILSLGPSLGMVRVPGIGLVCTNLVTGVPAVFGHFVTNLPAFHEVIIFICIKFVQVPYVNDGERFLVTSVGPKEYSMFRCVARYGYKDLLQDYDFENKVVHKIILFIEMEGQGEAHDPVEIELTFPSHKEKMIRSIHDFEVTVPEKGRLESSSLRDECLQILRAKECGVAYILGHSYGQAKKSSSIIKRFAIDVVYAFLSQNFRGTNVAMNVPYTSLLKVGMIYHV